MKYKNISGSALTVGNVNGNLRVMPNEEFLTAKKFAQPLIETGLLEEVKEPVPAKKTTKKGD